MRCDDDSIVQFFFLLIKNNLDALIFSYYFIDRRINTDIIFKWLDKFEGVLLGATFDNTPLWPIVYIKHPMVFKKLSKETKKSKQMINKRLNRLMEHGYVYQAEKVGRSQFYEVESKFRILSSMDT